MQIENKENIDDTLIKLYRDRINMLENQITSLRNALFTISSNAEIQQGVKDFANKILAERHFPINTPETIEAIMGQCYVVVGLLADDRGSFKIPAREIVRAMNYFSNNIYSPDFLPFGASPEQEQSRETMDEFLLRKTKEEREAKQQAEALPATQS